MPCVSLEWFEEVCFQTEQLREYGGKCVGEGFPRKFRQSIMGRASSGVDRRGGRKKGRELVWRWRGGAGGVNNGGPDLLRKPAVDLARTCHFQGAHIFNQERTYVKQVNIPT